MLICNCEAWKLRDEKGTTMQENAQQSFQMKNQSTKPFVFIYPLLAAIPSPQTMDKVEDQQHKMSTSCCVRWILVGMANQAKEMWIADQPILLFIYLWQYAPTWAWFFTDLLGRKMVQNFKAGLVGYPCFFSLHGFSIFK